MCYPFALFVGIFACVQLSFSAWSLYKIQSNQALLDVARTPNVPPLPWNPFVSDQEFSHLQTESEKVELVKRMNQMYFPDDKALYAVKLLPLIQSQINSRPYNKERWLELLELQTLARSNAVDRMWSAETALILGGWDVGYQSMVGLICLEEPSQLIVEDRAFCERRLELFSNANTRRSLSLLGVDVLAVNERLELLITSFCLFCE